MDQKPLLLLSALVVCLALSVHGSSHLMFSNNTQVDITQTGCGMTKHCVESPANCDPAGNTDCLFSSVTSRTSTGSGDFDLDVELRGQSPGYIALGITQNETVGKSMVFVCGRNSTEGSFLFRTTERDNTDSTDSLTPTERIVKEIRGLVSNGSVIQCEFTVSGVNATNGQVTILLGTALANGSITSLSINRTQVLNLAQVLNGTMMTPTMTHDTTVAATMMTSTTMTSTTMTNKTEPQATAATVTPASSATARAASLLLWCCLIWPIMHLF